MQYLLTKKEYDKLKEAANRAIKKEVLQKLCTLVADNLPIDWNWGATGKDEYSGTKEFPKPWGCILTKQGEWYCDECPVKKECPYEYKDFSI